jgi:3-isopropylmalate dehydrogenase
VTEFNILILPGDGIGPEVVKEGCRVLEAVHDRFGHEFELIEETIGGAAIDRYGVPIRDETINLARQSDAVLFGAVGGPKWDDPKAPTRAGGAAAAEGPGPVCQHSSDQGVPRTAR